MSEEIMIKKTPFYDRHVAFHAKIVEFAGFEMPVSYEGINAEHLHVRQALGVFDVSHMGEFFVEGPGAQAFLQTMTVNDVEALRDGQAQYSAMCYDDAGIVDDLIVYRFDASKYMLVVNAANLEKDFFWLQQHLNGDVTLTDRSDDLALLAVQGPDAMNCIQKLCDIDVSEIEFYHFRECRIAGEEVLLSRTGYTGEKGFEIYHSPLQSDTIWDALFQTGKAWNIKPIGLGARDTLRLEMKYCLYGNDIDSGTNPLEAGLGWITRLNKNGDFIGKDALLKIKEAGLKRKLVGFKMIDRGIPRHGYEVDVEGQISGIVTSGTQSPTLGEAIGLAYVDTAYAKVGNEIRILIRGKALRAKVVKTPFTDSSPL